LSIARINEFRAREGRSTALLDLIRSFLPLIIASEGCLSCQLLLSEKDPQRIVVVELWESVESHKASLKKIPQGAMIQALMLIEGPPTGEYFSLPSTS